MKEATKEKSEKIKKRRAAFKETSRVLCPVDQSLRQIALDSSVARINTLQGNGSRTLSERQENEVEVLEEFQQNILAHGGAGATAIEITLDDDGLEIPTKENTKRSLTKGSGTPRPRLNPIVDAQTMLKDRGDSRKKVEIATANSINVRARTALYEQLKQIEDLRSSGLLSAEDAHAEADLVKEALKKLRAEA
jgi:hypothetical protein